MDAIDEIHNGVLNYMETKGLIELNFIDEDFVSFLSELASSSMETYKVSEKAGLFSWATTRDKLKDRIRLTKKRTMGGVTTEQIRDMIEGDTRLLCLSIADPYVIKQLAVDSRPGDFSSECYRVIDHDNHKGSGNHKSSVKDFKVRVHLDGKSSDIYRLRVIVYGTHTLNQPTLDKLGLKVEGDDTITLAFTSYKVPFGSKIKACAV